MVSGGKVGHVMKHGLNVKCAALDVETMISSKSLKIEPNNSQIISSYSYQSARHSGPTFVSLRASAGILLALNSTTKFNHSILKITPLAIKTQLEFQESQEMVQGKVRAGEECCG